MSIQDEQGVSKYYLNVNNGPWFKFADNGRDIIVYTPDGDYVCLVLTEDDAIRVCELMDNE